MILFRFSFRCWGGGYGAVWGCIGLYGDVWGCMGILIEAFGLRGFTGNCGFREHDADSGVFKE